MFRKKSAEKEEEKEEESKEIVYSPEELSIINELVQDYSQIPGQVDTTPEEKEEEGELSDNDELSDLDNQEDLEVSPDLDAKQPESSLPNIAKPADNALSEFDDLANLDLDTISDTESPPADDLGFDLGEPAPPADDLGFDLGEPAPPADDLGFDLGEPAPPADDLGFDLGEPAPPADDLGFDLGEPAPPADDLGFDLGEPAPPADDLGFDLGEPAPPADDLGFDLGEPAPPADDLGFDLGEPAPPADDMGFDLGEPTPPADDLGFDLGEPTPPADDLGFDLGEPTPPADDLGFDLGEPAPKTTFEEQPFNLTAPSLDDLNPEVAFKKPRKKKSSLDSELMDLQNEQSKKLSPTQVQTIREHLKRVSPLLRNIIIDTLLQDKLPGDKSEELTQKLLNQESENELKDFIETQTGKKLADIDLKQKTERKTLYTKPQYSEGGLERQARLLKITRVAALVLVGASILFTGSYHLIIKKILYNNAVSNGKEILLWQDSLAPREIEKAEKYFNKAISYYPEKSFAYLQFAEAYRRRGLYENSFEKLFGKVELLSTNNKAIRYMDQELTTNEQIWNLLNKVPIVEYGADNQDKVVINNILFKLVKKGAYIITHLDLKKDEAIVLYALGDFHSNPARRFYSSPYRNNILGIDYYQRIITFTAKDDSLFGEDFKSKAILGIGNVYYNQKDFYRSHDYYNKIIEADPKNVDGQAGMLRTLIQLYKKSNDPRLIIQQHSKIKHAYKIEKELPLYILARLAAFYIDLPETDDLRIQYNVSPVDNVNGQKLRGRAEELLNIIFQKNEKDMYGNVLKGKEFAEGYYQRGRYYRYVVKEVRMAMSQFEYAYKYNPDHFMALNDRAEVLMELYDNDNAKKHLELAITKISEDKLNTLGDRPEDDTLLEADLGKIYFNLAKSIYNTTVTNVDTKDRWLRLQETEKFNSSGETGRQTLINMLEETENYFNQALKTGLKEEKYLVELNYYMGWSNYIKNNYQKALFYWQSISTDAERGIPTLEMAKSYALYYQGIHDPQNQMKYMETALSHLMYLLSVYTNRLENISDVNLKEHENIFTRLIIIENNLGAVYEVLGSEENALKHYWQSIEYSKKVSRENEISQFNIRLSFRRDGLEPREKYPLIMDYISPYTEEKKM